jgi:hypothetical protein
MGNQEWKRPRRTVAITRALLFTCAATTSLSLRAELAGTTAIIDTGEHVYLIGTTSWNELSDWAYNEKIGVKIYGTLPYATYQSYWIDIRPDKVASGYISAAWRATRKTKRYTVGGQHRHRLTASDPWQYFETAQKSKYVIAYKYLP